jgi:hypothetical protein
MTHLSERQLVLHYYGEENGATEAHLAGCPACRAGLERLRRTLALVPAPPVPRRDETYGARVWRRLRPALPESGPPRWQAWLRPRRLVWAGTMAALVLAAFLAGRVSQRESRPLVAEARPEAVRERILLVAVGPHLERSQMVLLEVMNADPRGPLDVAAERELARDLLSANRLYRQAARRGPDQAVGAVLDQLEQALIEIANGPAELDSARLAEIQERIRSQGLLFRIRVLGSKANELERRSPLSSNLDTT